MNAILLLKENTEPMASVDSNLPRVTLHQGDATPGCTCDRWGHPCKSRLKCKSPQLDDGTMKDEMS
jgi:hypothetical protein